MGTSRLLKTGVLLAAVAAGASHPGRQLEARRAGKTLALPAQADLQGTLNAAQPGDTIVLTPGGTYTGPFHLPRKPGNGWITIQSAPSSARPLPGPNVRVQPADAAAMAKIVSDADPAIVADPGAHHYRFVGVEIAPVPGTFVTNLVELGDARTPSEVPHDLVFERCYIHGDPVKGSRRGIALNSAQTSVRDSYLADFKEAGADSQALAGWNGPGPFHIIDNFIQAAGENVLFGGADPSIPNLVPSDIEILRNTISKPLSWRVGEPQYVGTEWDIKNLLELKNARRVRIEGNTFENNWAQAQNGFAILFTVRNQDGGAPWSTLEDITFVNNIVSHAGGGINILGYDDANRSQQARRITIRNNLFTDVKESWGTGLLFQLLNGTANVTIDHNTGQQTGAILAGGDSRPHTSFVFENNIAPHNDYGIIGDSTGVGNPTIERYFPGAVILDNVIAGGDASLYPPDNFFPGSLDDVRWVDILHGNFRLAPDSPYKGRGTDGGDLGADLDAIQTAIETANPVSRPRLDAQQALDGRRFGQVKASIVPLPEDVTATRVAALVLMFAVFLIGYVYVGYAATIWCLAKLRPKRIGRRTMAPSVSIVVVVHNEEDQIERRIENLLRSDYPEDKVEVVIASDGSTDRTVEWASRRVSRRVRLIGFAVRRGKPAVLNDVIPRLRSAIVVLADARQEFEPQAISALVRCFADRRVGAVSGELMIRPCDGSNGAGAGARTYWRYEKIVRRAESAIDSTIGATGAIYAIRRSLFDPVPEDTILDDVLIPMRIARRGYRVVFESAARAYDAAPKNAQAEFVRKARTIAGNAQLFARERWLLSPAANRLWLQTLSHKALRLLLPPLYVAAFLANLVLVGSSVVYDAAFIGQAAFYLAALAGVVPAFRRVAPLLVIPYEICFLNWAAAVGLVRFLSHRQPVTWDRSRAAA